MAIIYSYPKTTPVASDLLIISRLPSDPNETASYSVSIEDLASLISGTGTVTTFSATSSIPGITTTVTNSTTTPNLALSITGTPASGTYLDHAGNFTTPPGSGSVGTLSYVLTQGNTTGGTNILVDFPSRIQASATNANLQVQGNGTGKLEVRSADAVTPGAIQLNCEQNSHGVSLQSPAHSAAATYTLKLPTTVGTNTWVLQTDGNNPAQLSWAANSGSTNLSNTAYSTNVFLASDTGTDTTIAAATTSLAGVLTAADKTKLDGIQTAADTYDLSAGTKVGINVPLNLTSGSGSDNSLVTLTEGSGVTLTRNSATQITIASSGGGGGATDINGLSDGSTTATDLALGSTNLNGSSNTIAGQLAAQGTYATNMTAFGYRAARYLSTGSQGNVAIGNQTLDGLGSVVQNAQYNTVVGNGALIAPISGASYNTAIGANAMATSNISGTYMIGIGYNSSLKFKTGSYNICIGTQSGESTSPEPASWSASTHNVFIGARASGAYTTGNTAIDGLIRIGSYGYTNTAIEMLSHQCVIGNDGSGTGVNDTTTIRPVKNNTTDLGTSTAKYKDIYYDGILQSGTLNIAPASATATGTTGEIRFTADYIYVCVATNTWKRTAISTW